jgi:hypothetical protein
MGLLPMNPTQYTIAAWSNENPATARISTQRLASTAVNNPDTFPKAFTPLKAEDSTSCCQTKDID